VSQPSLLQLSGQHRYRGLRCPEQPVNQTGFRTASRETLTGECRWRKGAQWPEGGTRDRPLSGSA